MRPKRWNLIAARCAGALATISLAGTTLVATTLAAPVAGATTNAQLGPDNAARMALAQRVANALGESAPLPAGATSVSAATVQANAPAVLEVATSSSPDKAVVNAYYRVPSSVALAAWLNDQRVDGHGPSSSGSSSSPSGEVQTVDFGGPTSSIINSSELTYAFSGTVNDEIYLDVQAVATYLPQKPPASIIATGATRLTVRLDRGLNATTNRYANATTTNESLIATIIARVNALPAANPVAMPCPADFGALLTMRFFAPGATKPYAVVSADPGGCGTVTIADAASKALPGGVADVAGGYDLSRFVAARLGLKDLEVL